MFKIRIACTSKEELSFQGRKISNKNKALQKMFSDMEMQKWENIQEVWMLHKCFWKKDGSPPFRTKTLEFICRQPVSWDLQFLALVAHLKQAGFASDAQRNNHFEYMENGIVKWKCHFHSVIPREVNTQLRNTKNKSTYRVQHVFST